MDEDAIKCSGPNVRFLQVVGDPPKPEARGRKYVGERLKYILQRDAAKEPQAAVQKLDGNRKIEKGSSAGAPLRTSPYRQGRDRA